MERLSGIWENIPDKAALIKALKEKGTLEALVFAYLINDMVPDDRTTARVIRRKGTQQTNWKKYLGDNSFDVKNEGQSDRAVFLETAIIAVEEALKETKKSN
jgi:hypothetical protein